MNTADNSGTITAAFGRHYEVTLASGKIVNGIPKGKKSPFACGDHVTLGPLHDSEAQILAHAPRTGLLYRSDQWKQKLIAANATQVVLVVATEPGFSDELISRATVAALHEHMRVVIVLNKADLTARRARTWCATGRRCEREGSGRPSRARMPRLPPTSWCIRRGA